MCVEYQRVLPFQDKCQCHMSLSAVRASCDSLLTLALKPLSEINTVHTVTHTHTHTTHTTHTLHTHTPTHNIHIVHTHTHTHCTHTQRTHTHTLHTHIAHTHTHCTHTHTQNVVTRQWTTLSPMDHAQLRHILSRHLISSHSAMPPFIKNKQIKLIVLMGRADWPQEYSGFFTDILQVCGRRRVRGVCVCRCVEGGEWVVCACVDVCCMQEGEWVDCV